MSKLDQEIVVPTREEIEAHIREARKMRAEAFRSMIGLGENKREKTGAQAPTTAQGAPA